MPLTTILNMALLGEAVSGGLNALEAGLNIRELFKLIKSKHQEDSIEYLTICALEDSLQNTCKELEWEYDSMAVSQEIDITKLQINTLIKKEKFGELFAILLGRAVEEDEISVFIDNFDKTVADDKYVKLCRYLNLKLHRYNENTINENTNNPSDEADKQDNGILNIIEKNDCTDEFWEDILLKAKSMPDKGFIITGSTFSRWIQPRIREVFISTLNEIIKE